MIQKKRINNDVFVRWGVFTPEGLPVDLTEVTSINIEARPQSSNGRYPMVSEVVDNFVEAYFLAKDQKVVGKYNLYLTYTINDPNIIGGVATYTIDYCDAFELLPKSCFVDGEDDIDPVNIQGIISSFTYSMLTEEEKNDLASRLSDNSGAQNLSDLLDVTISNLEIDQILKYDGTKWVNAPSTGGSSSNVSWGIPTSQYTPLTVNGVTRNLSLNNHTHSWDTITNRPLTDAQFQDLLEISGLWKLDNNGNLYTERNVYSHGEVSAYNWGESPTPPVGVYNLKDLLDVGITNPQENNILRFNGTHWVNVPASDAGTLVEWSSETDNYVDLLVGDSSKSISLHGHKHEIEDINNLQDSLNLKQDNIPLGDISQYYRGNKEWATLNTDTVVESTNLYYTPERVIELTRGLYAQKDHTHSFGSLTGLPNTLDGYGIIDAYNKTEIDNLISSTSGFWVKSVGLEAPTGFTVSNSPIIYEGNIKLSFASGYSLPSNSKQYNWDLAFSDRHTHTNINVLNELNINDVNNWNSIQEHLNDYNNPHQVTFKQLINKPSTLLGYGITDVYNKTEVDYIFSNITPGESTIKNVYEYDSINQSFSDATITDTFNAYTISRLHARLTILEQGGTNQGDTNLDTIVNWYNNIGRYWLLDANNDALYTTKNVYSTKEVSAYGLGSGGGGGGGGVDMLDSWANYTTAKANFYAPASLLVPFRNDTLSRLTSLESGSATSIVTTGSGNAITSLTKSGSVITATKGLTFALASHTHTIAQITGLQGALDLKASQSDIDTAINNIEIGGRNLWINSRTTPATVTVGRYGYLSGYKNILGLGLRTGELMTFSVHVSNIPAGESVYARIDFVRPDGTYLVENTQYISNEGVAYISTFMRDTSEFDRIRYRVVPVKYTANYQVNVVHEKLERGNKATPWTPAPEDQVSDWSEADVTSFSYIKNKPTTLSGYGITDAVTTNTTQTITGTKTFNKDIFLGINISINGTKGIAGVWNVNDSLWRFGSDIAGSVANIRSEKVGIGTDSPLYKLDVSGTGRFTGNITASAGVNTPKVDFGNGFTIEPSGTELVFKYNGVIKQRMLSNGTILATGGITALST